MGLKEELLALEPFWGKDSEEFEERVQNISERYNTENDKKIISQFITEKLSLIDEKIEYIKNQSIKKQLEEISEIVSFSYIAKKYFGKSRQWLFQRIYGYKVNGKPARFSDKEIEVFNSALKDISKKIGSLSISV